MITIQTSHIQKLLQSALTQAQYAHDTHVFRTEFDGDQLDAIKQKSNDATREGLLMAIRQAEHAASELKAELHKLEYGYDIS